MRAVFYVGRVAKIIIGGFFALAVFVLLWGAWGYFSGSGQAAIDRSNAMEVSKKISEEGQEFSEPRFSGLTPGVAEPDFFTEYRLERDKIRSERSDVLRDILKNAPTDETRSQAQNEILQMTLEKRLESEMENLIKSKGFGDALVFIRENSVSAVVKSTSLSKEEVIQVADVINRICGAKAEDITVSAKP